ncbi:MAG: hypothetical protein ACO1SX_18720 [Actinomycetota bacterium]
MRQTVPVLCCALALLCACHAAAQPAPAPAAAAPTRLPVREITVFKDGHAFVLHQGRLPVTEQGTVLLDHLPSPVLGTSWPYSGDKNAKLASVTASPREVTIQRPATSVADLLLANPGAQVELTKTDGKTLRGQILAVPLPDSKPLAPTQQPGVEGGFGGGGLGGFGGGMGGGGFGFGFPQPQSQTLLLKTADGVLALPLGLVQSVTFKGDYKRRVEARELRNLLTLKLDKPAATEKTAEVGLFYLQQGIRWIPNYRVDIDGKGTATIELQATLINEMVDLENVTANLVIGVPTFFFKDTPDPISLQQTFPRLSRYFQPDSQTAFAFSNAIMSQGGFGGMAGGGGLGGGGGRFCGSEAESGEETGKAMGADPCQAPPALDAVAGDKNEDLFVFTARNVSLKKGQTMVLPISRATMPYRDVYALEIGFAPPREVSGNVPQAQQAELARLLRTPRAQHRLRLQNNAAVPLTTAPALVVSGQRVLAQSMMAYAPPGGVTDLTLTTASDIQVRKTDRETMRAPRPAGFPSGEPLRVEMEGTISLNNLRGAAVDLEVARHLLGNVDSVTGDGKAERLSIFEDESEPAGELRPSWWRYYSWPTWWFHRNSVSKITWKVRLEPGQPVELGYKWHYFAPN